MSTKVGNKPRTRLSAVCLMGTNKLISWPNIPYNLDPKVRLVYDLLLGNNIRRGIGRILEIASLARLRPLYVIRCAYRHFSRMSGSRAIPCFAVHGSLRIRLDLRSRCLAPPISSYIRSWHRWSLISGVCPDFYMPSMRQAGGHSSGSWESRSAGFCIDLLWNTYALWDLDNL